MFTDLLPASISGLYKLLFLIEKKSLQILTAEQTEEATTTV
jgi:hypothetical protein